VTPFALNHRQSTAMYYRSPLLNETAAATTAEGDELEIIFNGYGARRSPTPRWFDREFQPPVTVIPRITQEPVAAR
jgi:hypothetical protein